MQLKVQCFARESTLICSPRATIRLPLEPWPVTRMQQRLDTPEGREQSGQRFDTVEPVFGNLRYHKRLDRFTLRGRAKVNG